MRQLKGRNFKCSSLYRETWPTHKGSLKSFVWSSMQYIIIYPYFCSWNLNMFIFGFSTKVIFAFFAPETMDKWTEFNHFQARKTTSLFILLNRFRILLLIRLTSINGGSLKVTTTTVQFKVTTTTVQFKVTTTTVQFKVTTTTSQFKITTTAVQFIMLQRRRSNLKIH